MISLAAVSLTARKHHEPSLSDSPLWQHEIRTEWPFSPAALLGPDRVGLLSTAEVASHQRLEAISDQPTNTI